MSSVTHALSTGNRPKNLLRAAKAGMMDYDRRKSLRRLLGPEPVANTHEALGRLEELEAHADGARRVGSASYSPIRHVELLMALLSEARLARG